MLVFQLLDEGQGVLDLNLRAIIHQPHWHDAFRRVP